MGFFEHRVLTPGMKKEFGRFLVRTHATLVQLQREARTKLEAAVYANADRSLLNTPILFYDSDVLSKNVRMLGKNLVAYSVTKGENVREFEIQTRGNQREIIMRNYIKLPVRGIFDRHERMTADGEHTAVHEICGHAGFPTLTNYLVRRVGFSPRNGEEATADLVAAKIKLRQTNDPREALGVLSGRMGIYGRRDFGRLVTHIGRISRSAPRRPTPIRYVPRPVGRPSGAMLFLGSLGRYLTEQTAPGYGPPQLHLPFATPIQRPRFREPFRRRF